MTTKIDVQTAFYPQQASTKSCLRFQGLGLALANHRELPRHEVFVYHRTHNQITRVAHVVLSCNRFARFHFSLQYALIVRSRCATHSSDVQPVYDPLQLSLPGLSLFACPLPSCLPFKLLHGSDRIGSVETPPCSIKSQPCLIPATPSSITQRPTC